MKKVVRLTESELVEVIKRVVEEEKQSTKNEVVEESLIRKLLENPDALELLIPLVLSLVMWLIDFVPKMVSGVVGGMAIKIMSVLSPKVRKDVEMMKQALNESFGEDGALLKYKALKIANDILTDKKMTSLIVKAATTTNNKKKEEYLKTFNDYMEKNYPESNNNLKEIIQLYIQEKNK